MNKKREIICICCPRGCHLQVDPENDYNVTGNACPNGAAYGKEELTHPTRILTSRPRRRCPKKRSCRSWLRWTASRCTHPSAPGRSC